MELNKPLKFSNINPLEIIEPYNPQVVEFESCDDFNAYYSRHKDDFNETTQKLNKKYKIPGYKLTNLKGQLKIIKDYSLKSSREITETSLSLASTSNEKSDYKEQIKSLQESFQNMFERINELEKNLSIQGKQIEHIQAFLQNL